MRDVYSGREGFNTFLKLPEETISDILVLLDARDLLRCAQVSSGYQINIMVFLLNFQ